MKNYSFKSKHAYVSPYVRTGKNDGQLGYKIARYTMYVYINHPMEFENYPFLRS